MQENAFGLIYTGESNLQLRDITYSRSIAAVPFGGRYRCIDFILSSMVNSGISNVGLIAQKNYHSLMDHLGSGKEWDLHRKRDGLFILPPFLTRENTGIYRGTVEAFRSCMGYIRRSSQRYVILSGSHTIFNTTLNEMLAKHIETGADITIMYNEFSGTAQDEQFDDLRLTMDGTGRIYDLQINPYIVTSRFRSCDVFIMEKTLLEFMVEECYAHANYDFIRDIIVKKVGVLKMFGWEYDGYVARLDTIGDYFSHNMALLDSDVRSDLFNKEHPIYTKVKDEVPARYTDGSFVKNAVVTDGCIIEGSVQNSVLFRGVHVGRNSNINNCILMQGAEIQDDCTLEYVIMDKGVTVNKGRRLIGQKAFPIILRKGVTV